MYTLVQHSGYGFAGDPSFRRAVEEEPVTEVEAEKVRKAGGLLFADYAVASKYAHDINYPPEVGGLVPFVKGSFHPKAKFGGLRMYVPSEWDRTLVSIEEIMES